MFLLLFATHTVYYTQTSILAFGLSPYKQDKQSGDTDSSSSSSSISDNSILQAVLGKGVLEVRREVQEREGRREHETRSPYMFEICRDRGSSHSMVSFTPSCFSRADGPKHATFPVYYPRCLHDDHQARSIPRRTPSSEAGDNACRKRA